MRTMHMGRLVLVFALAAFGCGSDDENKNENALQLIGEWRSTFDGKTFSTETITADTWTNEFGSMTIEAFDNDKNVVIVLNPADAMFGPNTYSKIVFTEPKDDSFYYCTTDFNLDTLKEAQASDKTADDSDPSTDGCGGSPWTQMSKK